MFVRTLILAVGLVAAGTATAQSLGRPAEFYFESDANTVKPISEETSAQKLLKRMERDPRAKAEAAQLAHIAMDSGRTELGRELYARALSRIDRTDVLWRAVMWNYGWDLYRAGDAEGALDQWQTLQSARASTASWIPPTNALVLWTLGRKDEAVQWYAAAVRTEPRDWATAANHARLLPGWRENERAVLAEVQAAWAANPPAWP